MPSHQRIRRQHILREAEGYLELEMPGHALEALAHLSEVEQNGVAYYLRGEALRALGRHGEAIEPLKRAAECSPSEINIWLALGWCYKRSGRIDLAIEALEEALEAQPDEAIIHYNLACYWSLAGNKRQAILLLGHACELDPEYRERAASETDFDPIRNDPGFRSLTSVIV